MKKSDEKNDATAPGGAVRWARWIRQATLVFAGGCAGVVLYHAMFPAFYYMNWIAIMPLLWIVFGLAWSAQYVALLLLAKGGADPPDSFARSGAGFLGGLLLLVTVLVGFKVPLYASFLLARPDLEEAVRLHSDDLEQVGRLAQFYHCGIYPIRGAERRCHVDDRIYFRFRDDGESAIIYSESGIGDLCYNSGSKGHLLGNWYWMKED